MLAEAIHSFAESGNQGLLLWGMRQAARPPSVDYPLGHGKAVYFWSFMVALVLFTLGGVFSLYEGWHKLSHPQPLEKPWVAIAVLVFGLVAEGISLRACLGEIARVRGTRSLWRWFRDSRSSELVVVLGEDIAALIGLALALAAVARSAHTGDPYWDALGSMAIGAVLIVVAVLVGYEVKGLLIGQSGDPRTVARLRDFLKARSEIEELYELLTLQLGPELMIAAKIKVRATTAREVVDAINRVEAAVYAEFPEVEWLFVEPDVAD